MGVISAISSESIQSVEDMRHALAIILADLMHPTGAGHVDHDYQAWDTIRLSLNICRQEGNAVFFIRISEEGKGTPDSADDLTVAEAEIVGLIRKRGLRPAEVFARLSAKSAASAPAPVEAEAEDEEDDDQAEAGPACCDAGGCRWSWRRLLGLA